MKATMKRKACALAAVAVVAEPLALAQTAPADWAAYGRDSDGGRYSPLRQITAANVRNLRLAWSYHMRPAEIAAADATDFRPSEVTPVVVAGVMYFPTPYGHVVALNADTGAEIWKFLVPGNGRGSFRGVAYWPGDGTTGARIVFGTNQGKLIALDAATGALAAGFGDGGIVEMKTAEVMNGLGRPNLVMTSPPLVVGNLVVTGSRVQEYPSNGPTGDVRAWDARTGKLVWTFHTIPRPGEPGFGSWEGESWKNRSGANVWTHPIADTRRGIVYLPVATPSFDRWGGDRKGAGLFGNSIVAVEAATGKYLWHFQTVHHDLWDVDLPNATLIDVKRGRRTIPAIAVANKMALLFILDRVTGKPIYEVKETPVPTETDLPGEQVWPTQPVPVAPPPLARTAFRMSELTDLTPEIKAGCEKLAKDWNVVESKFFQPPLKGAAVAHLPGGQGGVSWGGSVFDPVNGLYITNITNLASPAQLGEQADGSYGLKFGYRYFWTTANRIPCQKPPWGQLVAVDVNTGTIAWRKTLGVTDSLPAALRDTGRPSAGGPIGTAGGVTFIGATDDSRFRAFDSRTGRPLWEVRLAGSIYASPMTYADRSGKQYVAAVSTGGMTGSDATNDEVLAYALP